MAEGRCLCGALRYEADAPFQFMVNCHCSMCRKHHGARSRRSSPCRRRPFGGCPAKRTSANYHSSEDGSRRSAAFAARSRHSCFRRSAWSSCPAGNLDGDLGVTPQMHIFAGSRAPWYEITDSLPRSEEYPPDFDAAAVDRPQITPRPGVVDGSCLCGDVAFEMRGTPRFMTNCHCSRCRRGRSAAHATNLFYPARCVPVDARRDAGRRLRRCPMRGTSAPRSAGAAAARAARFGGAGCRRGARRDRSTSTRACGRPNTSSWARRRPGSRSPTTSRNTRTCRPLSCTRPQWAARWRSLSSPSLSAAAAARRRSEVGSSSPSLGPGASLGRDHETPGPNAGS